MKARGRPAPNRPAMSKARSIAPNSIWASACSIAIRLRCEPALPRFGICDGGSNGGAAGRAGRAGMATPKSWARSPRRQARAAARAAFTLACGRGRQQDGAAGFGNVGRYLPASTGAASSSSGASVSASFRSIG